MKERVETVDVWRETSVRYLGYANEIGEAFRPVFPKFVRPSYALAFGYCIGDTVDKAYKTCQQSAGNVSYHKVALTCFDTLLWQTLASVLIPGFTINKVVKLTQYAVNHTAGGRTGFRMFLPTVFGLSCIPIIIKPIDEFVDLSLDSLVRPFYPDHVHK
mmetsp:Transcript_10298/g.11832  ORF Transcript_10298/g.11832 Transcript_10298/m.11832 type:complete len:159 (-) Transcript_10298:847-1323(-)|eukprot:CAMPEP_0184019372 /NCGR_PEP_ID=MMETSP0954-20121128/8716_1 /TAXON_ID=627963 /ORGANISM="Aplanochytrium sp, Strain PBS07" /LENGTH=158 /DNA_ID=CAMNT_0026301033 /DNA_START=27 /DNA_END=503 /DNA_ORIENTATION=-